MTYYFSISNLYLSCLSNRKTIISDSVEYHRAKFIFDENWLGYAKSVTFNNTKSKVSKLVSALDVEDSCDIPWEVLADDGYLTVCVQGINGDSSMVTKMPNPLLIEESDKTNGSVPLPPTPTVYEQIISMIENIHPEIDPDELAVAVDAYMEEHPIDAITEEQMEEYVNTFFEEHKSELVGPKGDNGLSAYQIAVDNGYVGTEVQWLESLKGANGGTFIPSVSEDGILSWTNNLGLPNPDPVNIKGRDLVNQGVEISPIDNTVSIIMQPNVRYFVDGAISSLIITAPENYNPWDEFYIKFTTSTSGCVVTPPAGWQYVEGCTSSFDANNVYEWDVLDGAIACPVGTAVA